jgi:putative transcriptional regulator
MPHDNRRPFCLVGQHHISSASAVKPFLGSKTYIEESRISDNKFLPWVSHAIFVNPEGFRGWHFSSVGSIVPRPWPLVAALPRCTAVHQNPRAPRSFGCGYAALCPLCLGSSKFHLLPAKHFWGTLTVDMSEPGKFLKGKLLLDGGALRGSFFHHTVVLVCEHNAEGAFGLVLNRTAGNKVGEVLVADLPDVLRESPLFLGGPVQPTALSFLHADSFMPNANVFPNLSLGHSLDDLVEIGESFSAEKKVKMFAGYAGWSPGQLENEIKRRAWLTFPASLELVFETPPEQLWQKILKSKGGWKNKLLSQMPEDLSQN